MIGFRSAGKFHKDEKGPRIGIRGPVDFQRAAAGSFLVDVVCRQEDEKRGIFVCCARQLDDGDLVGSEGHRG